MFIVQAQTRAEKRKKKYEARPADCVIEKFIIRQPPKGGKDDYDSENSWISDGLHSSS